MTHPFHLSALALLLLTPALPALADSLTLASAVKAVTVYPSGAEVTRQVAFTAAAPGRFDIVVPDLPSDAQAAGLHFQGGAGLTIGAFALRTDRLPPAAEPDSPAITQARQARDAARTARQQAESARDAILAKALAADAQVDFLAGVRIDGATLTPEALTALTGSVGQQVLAAKQAAIAARAEAIPAEAAVTEAQKAEDKAQAALDALLQPPGDHAALLMTVDVAAAGPVTLDVVHFVADASWSPVYDLALDDKAQPAALSVARSALVSQYSGEDWAGVDLTLSTAQPGQRSDPSTLYPDLRSIGDPISADRSAEGGVAMEAAPMVAAPAPAVATASADFQGVAVSYHLPAPVSVATDSEDLQIALDRLEFAPQVLAQAVPRFDQTAYVVANWVNTGAEALLPGPAMLHRDGTLVGMSSLGMVPPGQKVTTGFGALDGVVLKREIPDRSTGDRGVFTASTEQHEVAVLKVENLTDQAWTLRLIDQVPYSEQDDLKITWSADPAPAETDVDGQRGVLAWQMDLAAKAKISVTLDTSLTWPKDKVLQ